MVSTRLSPGLLHVIGHGCFCCFGLSFFPGDSVKRLPAVWETQGSVPGLGRSPGGGNGNPLQYSCPEKHMDRGAWRAPVHEVTEIRTGLSDRHFLLVSGSVGWKVWANLSTGPCGRSMVRSRFSLENKGCILRLEEVPCNLQLIFHPKILPLVLLTLTLGREGFLYLALHPNDPAFMSRDGY